MRYIYDMLSNNYYYTESYDTYSKEHFIKYNIFYIVLTICFLLMLSYVIFYFEEKNIKLIIS